MGRSDFTRRSPSSSMAQIFRIRRQWAPSDGENRMSLAS
ncbi:unnamed protein product [Linum tenue]|uniref:Uncharacterized protein n=1 Tax=Linum tenue TaxID=586396 RepID=A0AAV0ID90_9ROSI|nr:unnamed protein product [Linum tenue]